MKNINPENLSNEMSDALIQFRLSAQKIADLWNKKENESAMESAESIECYPFCRDFDEVCFGIDAWFNAIRDYNTPLQKNIKWVRSHRKEVIDCINDVCEVGQNLLNHGCPITYAEIYKTEDNKIFWLLFFNKGNYALTKDGTFPMPELTQGCVRIWHRVLENLKDATYYDWHWNDHYYSDKLPYDSKEIDVCIEFMEMDAEDAEAEKSRNA